MPDSPVVISDSPCDCTADGWCQRYGRQMSGRFRELCAGIDVDLGTAAAFRSQWSKEAATNVTATGYVVPTNSPRRILLCTHQAPGDAVAMTAAIYSLHRAHPGRYTTAVESPYPEVFAHNPDVVPATGGESVVQMHYPAVVQSNERGIHFMQAWCEHLGAALGMPVPLLTNHPHLYFNSSVPPVEDYWVVCSGGKGDFTAKLWGHERYQEVVDLLNNSVRFVQVGRDYRDHPKLSGVAYSVGRTTLRQLFNIVRRARGVVCGVSLLMHVAAALDKPAIVIAGGREPVQWNCYQKQHYLHTVGTMPCVSTQGQVGVACWRSRVLPLGDGHAADVELCERPTDGVPKCMCMIQPEEVSNLILRCDQSV